MTAALSDCSVTRSWSISSSLPVHYEIVETPALLDPANPALLGVPGGRGVGTRLIVLDQAIERLYGSRVRAYFESNNVPVTYLTLPISEEKKTLDHVLAVARTLNEIGTYRLGSPPIAIGGGVLTDVVGMAVSLYRRGIPYIRVPTTLLGQVDVSVAAKTGINFDGYRNRLGTYSPAARTLIDYEFLATVSPRHLRNGMAEVLKMALIKDARLFDLLDEHGAFLIDTRFQSGAAAREVITRAVGGMVAELEPNLWEKNLRRAVDYGHSFSPLVEMRALPELLHGEAVAVDCVFSAVLAAQRSFIGSDTLAKIVQVTRKLGLAPSHPLFTNVDLVAEALEDTVRHRDGQQNLPILTGIGQVCFLNDVTRNELAEAATTMKTYLPTITTFEHEERHV